MSRPRSTPGPWEWTDETGGELWAGSRVVLGAETHSVSLTEEVAVVVGEHGDLKLIEVAPELLRMVYRLHYDLALATTGYDYAERLDLGTVERDGIETTLEAARELLARAEGGEP